MGRPSVAAERRETIIAATVRAIATHGITGATLDRIAKEAGMSRGHVRHFVGNRDDLLVETAKNFYFDDEAADSLMPASVTSLSAALDFLFGDEFSAPGPPNVVAHGLVEASRAIPALFAVIYKAYVGMEEAIAEFLRAEAPEADAAARARVAQGIVASALGNIFMCEIQHTPERTAACRGAAQHLIADLRTRASAL